MNSPKSIDNDQTSDQLCQEFWKLAPPHWAVVVTPQIASKAALLFTLAALRVCQKLPLNHQIARTKASSCWQVGIKHICCATDCGLKKLSLSRAAKKIDRKVLCCKFWKFETHVVILNHNYECISFSCEAEMPRSLFQFSRRERVFLSFNLMFETGTRISFPQSHASRREREFHFSILGFDTRTRIENETILARIFGNYIYCLFID